MARKKQTVTAKSRIALYDRIFTNQEDFFTINLGYSAWKGVKTRIENSLKIKISEPMTPFQIYSILEHIKNSSSKAKVKAYELIELFKSKPDDLSEIIEEQNKPIYEISIPADLLEKYQVKKDDVEMKYNILLKKDNFDEELEHRIKVYRFEYDIKICKLLKEMRGRELI